MNTNYKNNSTSTIQKIQKKHFNFQEKGHPVNQCIMQNIGTVNFTATIKQDLPTLSVLKEIPGVVAFLTTLRINGDVVGEGRSHLFINQDNKYFERSIRFCSRASVIDAVVKSIKTVNTLHDNSAKEEIITDEDIHEAKIEMESGGATSKQKNYLTELVNQNIADEDEKGRFLSNINDFTKSEANKAIQDFKS